MLREIRTIKEVTMHRDDGWTPFQWHCVNCGRIVTALKNSDGDIKAECERCHTVMVRRIRNAKRDTLKVFAPGTEGINLI